MLNVSQRQRWAMCNVQRATHENNSKRCDEQRSWPQERFANNNFHHKTKRNLFPCPIQRLTYQNEHYNPFTTMPPHSIRIEPSESSRSLSSQKDGESTSDPSHSNTNARSDGSTSNGSFSGGHTKIVNRTKLVVYGSLLVASVAISVAAFFFVQSNEESAFEAEVRRHFAFS